MNEKIILKHFRPENLNKGLTKAAELVRQAAVYNLGPHNRTGELAQSIMTEVKDNEAEIFTNKEYAPYVEFGTGPRGATDHAGVSPEVSISYRMDPWWIHESMIEPGTAETYHWFCIDTPDGKFYRVDGSAAHPYLYPAIKDNTDKILEILKEELVK